MKTPLDDGSVQISSEPSLYFCTGSLNKLEEVQFILKGTVSIKHVNIDLPEIQGEPADIAKMKCRHAYDVLKAPVIVEDTCLCFNALSGLPGPYVKWFVSKIGPEGLCSLLAGYQVHPFYVLVERMIVYFLSKNYRKEYFPPQICDNSRYSLNVFKDKSAYALCNFCFWDGQGEPHIFEGRVDVSYFFISGIKVFELLYLDLNLIIIQGLIVEPRGPRNFGWDPVFQPSGFQQTYAEMDKTVKNSISHRLIALRKLKESFHGAE
ncbi:putative inosine triphosphate pyrophosphatase [Cardiosporidium cionae]|uniref:Inosine triphosphate pyrophosphatase n=1 Tax=Cardiosporidium cionae TaxID=476202 RepID=A0ABQ7JF20_9APIC|nr:putative inosine triphosphate pyrophosphatase [Cardiosporidium cionae]|eukprot:KAF8822617.1 putative inosine triphosphate pyrophosphatase [Cardiosporidium cionae]